MNGGIFGVFGGLGLFLIGMNIMTDGLKQVAGDALRRALARFTKSPLTGMATGAVGTAVLQSSSATTVMAVGFTGAGLLTFPHALGIIFGANLGTTITGWLVALLGFKLKLTHAVMPLIFVGAMMRLMGGRRVAAIGYALAGFGLVFAGINLLQLAMEGCSDTLTPDQFPPNTVLGRAALVLIGVVITLVTQSSSAGVATAITAVHVGSISLPQAAAMVIGMDVGTTFTAAMATIGGTTNARRTGIAHVIYNIMTGIGAFLCLTLFVDGWESFAPESVRSNPEIALVAFHTLFNGLGVLIVLPFTHQFARLIIRLIPARDDQLTRRLDTSLLTDPHVAIGSVDATLREISEKVFQTLAAMLRGTSESASVESLSDLNDAVEKTRVYLSHFKVLGDDRGTEMQYAVSVHVVDHLARLIRRCYFVEGCDAVRADREMSAFGMRLADLLESGANDEQTSVDSKSLEALWTQIDGRVKSFRRETIQRSIDGTSTTSQTMLQLDAIRWLRRVCYHAWRISHHLEPMADHVRLDDESLLKLESEPDDVGRTT